MRLVRSLFVVLAAMFLAAVAREARAQQIDPYVSCVKCHALPMTQAQGQMAQHGIGYLPSPEMACDTCHDTFSHEQNPDVPPPQRYFWPGQLYGANSYMTNLCTSCHPGLHGHAFDEQNNPLLEKMPYGPPPMGATTAPTSVLPLFDPFGAANQDLFMGGMVCSTCHDPHEPAYPYGSGGTTKFLRVGSPSNINQLCSACHDAPFPSGAASDLVIPSRSNSVSFTTTPPGDQQIEVTVKNRGNAFYPGGSALVSWVDNMGYPMTIGTLWFPSISPDQETTTGFMWMPPPGWAAGEGFYVFSLPPSGLLPGVSRAYVRAMDVLPPPQNLRVNWAGSQWIDLAWDMVPPGSEPVMYDVYRDGVKINFYPVYGLSYVDNGVAPETPHVYTVKAVDPIGNFSAPSNLAAGTTLAGIITRVPQDYPTIQAAIDAAQPGTSIHVAPGIYAEHLDFGNKQQVTVKGQDANGCILDYTSVNGGVIFLGHYPSPAGNTLSGFTIRNAQVTMGEGDALVGCVLVNDEFNPYPVVWGGGLVAQCVIDTGYAPSIQVYSFLASVNSIYLSGMPFDSYSIPPEYAPLLINNNFPFWPMWDEYPGSGNFSDPPAFDYPGPPSRYYTTNTSITIDRGLPLGTPDTYNGAAPDVGVFEFGRPYTPQPPGVLTATFQPGPPGSVQLIWSPSVGAPQGIWNYLIYRSTTPSFPSDPEAQPFMAVPWYEPTFTDFDLVPGTTYYYQVRADGGPAAPPATGQLLSGPTNTASAGDLNRAPVAVDDGFTTNEDQSFTYPVLLNDSDPDGDPLTLESIGQPQHGTAVINPDQQTVLYTPTPDYYGPDSFVYTVADGRQGSASATVSIQVNPVNDPPVALPDSYTVPEDSTLNIPAPGVLANDVDIEGDPLFTIRMGDPGFGTLALSSIGAVTYTPFVNFNGTDTFNYRPTDEKYGSSAVVAVTITVTPVNDPPSFGPVWDQIVGEDAGFKTVVGWAIGIEDGDPEVAQALSFSTTNTNSALFQVQPAVSPSGTLTYQPKDNMGGGTAIVTATLTDDAQAGGPAKSAARQFTITVGSVNYAPVASGQSVTTGEDTAKSVTLAATDADGDALTFSVKTQPTHGTLSGTAPSLTYTPAANYNGPDSFTFVANDGAVDSNTATVTITDIPANDPPVFVMGANQRVNNNAGAQMVAGWATGIGDGDPEVSQMLMFNVTNDNNALFAAQPIMLPDGTLSYMPAANTGGVATVTVSLTDDFSAGGPAITTPAQTFTITVNRPPVAMEQSVTTTRNTPLTVTLGAWDMDVDALTYAVVSGPAHGSLSGTAPNLTYSPALDYNGPDSFTFTADDGQATSAPALVAITVNAPPVANAGADRNGNIGQELSFSSAASSDPDGTITFSSWNWGDNTAAGYGGIGVATHTYANPGTYVVTLTVIDNGGATATDTLVVTVNAPPVANGQTVTVAEDGAVAVTLTGSDIDGDALTYAVTAGPAHGTLSGAAPNLTYTPAANYNGPDSFTFTAGDGSATSTSATVTISVAAVNDLPVAHAGTDQIGLVGQVLSFSGAGSSDVDGPIASYSWNWGDGTANGTGVSLTHAWTAAGTYTVTLTVTDGSGATATDTLAVTVNKVNLALNKTASASSTFDANTTAAKAVDGATATFWQSGTTGNQWVRVDLGTAKSISNIKVRWPAAYYAKSFKIQISTDNKKWTSVYETTAGNGSLIDKTFTPASARYVRVYCTRAVGTSYGVAELEVYQ